MGKKEKRNFTFLDRQLFTLMIFHVLQTLNKSTMLFINEHYYKNTNLLIKKVIDQFNNCLYFI